jgi:phospholipid/cholesterol/gamma-HCH transport system permease protein
MNRAGVAGTLPLGRRVQRVDRAISGTAGNLPVARRSLGVFHFIGELVRVLLHGLRPSRWRRTMREEFLGYLHEVGLRAVPAVVVAALLVGIGIILQVIYWLGYAGQEETISEFLVLTMIRQIAPVGTALIIIGRSGAVLVDEVGQLKLSGHLRLLASHGIDPIDFLLIPRALATAVASFLLTMAFLYAALGFGYLGALLTGLAKHSPVEFVDRVLGIMSLRDHVLLFVKPMVTGYAIAYISIWYGMRADPGPQSVRSALPMAFVTSLLTTFAISAVLSAVLSVIPS